MTDPRGPLRIAILGPASSGKSTLAGALAERYGTLWVPEYLREFCEERGRAPVADEQFPIASTQAAREDAAALEVARRGGRYLFCDTTPLMTAVYSRHYFGGIDSQLAVLAGAHARHYGLTLVMAADFPWVQQGRQHEPEAVSRIIEAMLLEELAARAIPYHLIGGPPQQRLAQVERLL
ncbi:AAA family ATPase [Oxalobacteraceae bacterium A2-2]